MNEKISSLFDSEINNKEVDTLLAKKNKMVGANNLYNFFNATNLLVIKHVI